KPVGARFAGDDEPAPGSMSATIVVPAAVPSLLHSSRPCTPSSALKNRFPLMLIRSGEDPSLPGRMSLTIVVPAAEPSLFQSSPPWIPSFAAKYSVPLTFVRYEGSLSPLPGYGGGKGSGWMFLTRTVPASVPLLFHSSCPVKNPAVPAKK